MAERAYVYMLASKRNGTLYVGVTSQFVKRIREHKQDFVDGFTARYAVHSLVWFEPHSSIVSAIEREKAIKKWKRLWKIRLINESNPEWRDLYPEIL